MPVTWKNLFTLIRCAKWAQPHANAPAAARPSRPPMIRCGSRICNSIRAVSIPSRVIIRNVKRNTPARAAMREVFDDMAVSRCRIRSCTFGPVRHM